MRIGLAQARVQQRARLIGAEQTAQGATAFDVRKGVHASLEPRTRIDKGSTTPNSRLGLKGAIAIGYTRRKKGYPPIATNPAFGGAGAQEGE